MQTARFEQIRKSSLKKVFDAKHVIKVWREIVRSQLRDLDIKDIYDCFDINFNIKERAQSIRSSVLNGGYKASRALVYKIEKKFGISRHMVIPQAIDALVLQVLTESVVKQVLDRQPSDKAFYSRAKHTVAKPHEVTEYGQTLRQMWIKLQKTIYKFSKGKKLMISTDLSNYYDSIDMRELKKVLTSYLKPHSEVVIDLLFGIIENISWHPDYLPYSGRGLPTSNLEAIRLLAHSFLFEVDEVLKKKTKNCFTRWMDDIVVGVDSKKEAREVISSISDMLKSRGLALNLAKTNIYDKRDFTFHFQTVQNNYLSDIATREPKTKVARKRIGIELRKKFAEHNTQNRDAKAWDKVAKRYITQFGRLKLENALGYICNLYISCPVLRPNILIYLSNLGYMDKTAKQVLKILTSIDIFDDISLYQLCNLVVEWEVLDDKKGKDFLRDFESKLKSIVFSRKNPLDFYSLLWFKTKYSRADTLLGFLMTYKNLWQADPFLRRQATAIFGRLYIVDNEKVKQQLLSQISSGEQNTVSVASQIQHFLDISSLNAILNSYLFTTKIQKPYPLPKFLVLCSVLNSVNIRNNTAIKAKILNHIGDPYYRKWLKQDYGIY